MSWPRDNMVYYCPICGGSLHNGTYEGESYRMCSACQRAWDVTQADRTFTLRVVDA